MTPLIKKNCQELFYTMDNLVKVEGTHSTPHGLE